MINHRWCSKRSNVLVGLEKVPPYAVILALDTKAIREFTGKQVFIGKQWHSETNKQTNKFVKMYVVCKMIQRRIFLWFIVELLHTSFTRKPQIPLEFILLRTYFDYIFNVFHFYICVPSFLFLFCRGLLFFFHCEVFHSIKTYFIMFFLFPFLYNSLLWFILFPDFLRQRSRHG